MLLDDLVHDPVRGQRYFLSYHTGWGAFWLIFSVMNLVNFVHVPVRDQGYFLSYHMDRFFSIEGRAVIIIKG